MITVEDICNDALTNLGAGLISSIDDGSTEARQCRAVYDTVRDSVLEEAWWQFATFYSQPDLITSEVIPGWAYLYEMPDKCITARNIFDDTGLTIQPPIEFLQCISPQTNARAIATNVVDPWVEFTYRVTDPSFYSPKFAECLALKLAAKIGYKITGNDASAKAALALYATQISEVKRLNGSAKHVISTVQPSYISVRG